MSHKTPSATQGPQVSNIISQELAEETPSKTKQKIHDIWEKPQRAELAEVLHTGFLNLMSSAECWKVLARTCCVLPCGGGVLTDALVDLGSLMIISLQFALMVLTKHMRSNESAKQWREAAQ